MAKIETQNYERIPFPIKAVRVTEENLEDIVKWSKGTLTTDDKGRRCVEVDVKRPIHDNQRYAYPGDWLTTSGSGYKVYLDDAFKRCFRLVPMESADPSDLKKLQEQYAPAQT
jgi:hypothetical protein